MYSDVNTLHLLLNQCHLKGEAFLVLIHHLPLAFWDKYRTVDVGFILLEANWFIAVFILSICKIFDIQIPFHSLL